MEMREVLAPAPSADESIEMGQRAGARVAGDAAELQDRLLTRTWDGTARGGAASRPAPAEGDVQHVQPPCSVRVITALDRGIGQYVVKEGDDVRLWLEKHGPPGVTQATWRLHKSKIDPYLQCRHHPSNGNVTEKRHRHRPNDLLMVTSSLGFDARPDAKDDGRIVYDLLYVCAGKFGGQVGGPGFCVGCRRSTRDLSGKTVVGWCNAIGGCSDRCTWDRKTPVHLCGMTLRITATMQQVFDKTRTITIKGSHEHDHQDQWHRSDEKPRQYLDGPAGCDFEVQRQTHHAQEGALYQQQAQQQMSVASQRGLVSPANVDSDLDQRLAVTQQPISAGAGLQSMSRPHSGGVGASGGAAVAAIMVGAGSGKRLREIESHHLEQPQQMPALDSPRKHSKRTGDSTGGLAEGPFQAHAQQKAVQLRLHHQHHQQQSQQHQHQQQQQQQLPREHCQPQQPAPSRKPRARAPKREFRDDVQQAIVDLPTITSQETSRRNHEEELQMQRTLRAKFLKSSAVNAERDEREKAQLASESLGTSPAWRTSVACMRVIAWLEAGEKLEQEMAAEEAKAGRSGMEGHGEGGMAGEDGIAGTSAFLARN